MKKLAQSIRKIIKIGLITNLAFALFFNSLSITNVNAQEFAPTCESILPPSSVNTSGIKAVYHQASSNNVISFTVSGLQPSSEYTTTISAPSEYVSVDENSDSTGKVTFSITNPEAFEHIAKVNEDSSARIYLEGPGIVTGFINGDKCVIGDYTIAYPFDCGEITVSQTNSAGQMCYAGNNGCLAVGETTYVSVQILNSNGTLATGFPVRININGGTGSSQKDGTTGFNGVFATNFSSSEVELTIGSNEVVIERGNSPYFTNLCETSFNSAGTCTPEQCNTSPTSIGGIGEPAESTYEYLLCEQIDSDKFPDEHAECLNCIGGTAADAKGGVWTAIGCIKRAPAEIAQTLIRVGLMMGGGAALLTMLAAGFILSVSQGDPKRTEEAKDMITAAFIGLIFIIFSVSILQFIGFTILKIPGFGG